MKVKELIALLQKQDPEKLVMCGTHDAYETVFVKTVRCFDDAGRETSEEAVTITATGGPGEGGSPS